jgi:DNA-binding MarR family transcriptional regulator
MRPSDIATLMDVKTPMATRLVKSLVEKNLIYEQPVSGDQRGKMIAMTKEGQGLLCKQEVIIRNAMREYMVDVPRDDLNAYLRVLAYLAHHQP